MSAIKHEARPTLSVVDNKSRVSSRQLSWRKVGIYAGVVVVIFLLGLIPMWLKARDYASERDAAQHELRLSQLENSLSAAVIDSRRADYEPARQTASDFFTALRAQVDNKGSDLTDVQRDRLKTLLAQRDDIITLLARSDPASADRLSDLYVVYRKAMSNVEPQNVK